MKLQAGLTEAHPLWTTLLDQEKISYQVVSGQTLTLEEFPVLLIARKPSGAMAQAISRYLAQGGWAVGSKAVPLALPEKLRARILTVDLPEEDFPHQGDALKRFVCGEIRVTETAALRPLNLMRRILVKAVKQAFWNQGLPYVRLAYYPFPHENVFSFRFDFDNFVDADFTSVCRLIEQYPGCTSSFINMKSHEEAVSSLQRLAKLPTEVASHAYVHHVYNAYAQNALNVEKSESLLKPAAGRVEGFSGPHGRWTPSLQRVLEERGYLYSSEFGLDYDGLPFFVARGGRRSPVLQIPVHPVCEGVFMEQHPVGALPKIRKYYQELIHDKLQSEEPIFIFGHPDSRIGRHPEIFHQIVQGLDAHAKPVWKTEFRQFARWWKKRDAWRFEATWQNDALSVRGFPKDQEASLELIYENRRIRLQGREMESALSRQELESRAKPYAAYVPRISEERVSLSRMQRIKRTVKLWLDWETKTPLHLYRNQSAPDVLRWILRALHDRLSSRKASTQWGYS